MTVTSWATASVRPSIRLESRNATDLLQSFAPCRLALPLQQQPLRALTCIPSLTTRGPLESALAARRIAQEGLLVLDQLLLLLLLPPPPPPQIH